MVFRYLTVLTENLVVRKFVHEFFCHEILLVIKPVLSTFCYEKKCHKFLVMNKCVMIRKTVTNKFYLWKKKLLTFFCWWKFLQRYFFLLKIISINFFKSLIFCHKKKIKNICHHNISVMKKLSQQQIVRNYYGHNFLRYEKKVPKLCLPSIKFCHANKIVPIDK